MVFRELGRRAWPGASPRTEEGTLRVLLVEDGVPGGVARAVDYLVAAWRDDERAFEAVRLSLRGPGGLARSVPVYARAALSFTRAVAGGRVDLLHLNITQRGSTWRALPLTAVAVATRVPILIHLHSSQYPAFLQSLPLPLRSAVGWMFRRAARVLVLGEGWADFVARELHVDPGRVEVLPNAVPGPLRLAERPHGPSARLLFLGRLGPRKGVLDLLRALSLPQLQAPLWELTLAGDGDGERYRAEAARLGLGDRVHVAGWVDADGVQRHLAEADLLVLPSYAEGLPLAVLEAFAHGVAVVTTPVGAIPEAVRDGRNGLLVSPGDVPALAVALHRLITVPALRDALGRQGRKTWERDHDPARHARRILEIYRDLAGDP